MFNFCLLSGEADAVIMEVERGSRGEDGEDGDDSEGVRHRICL